VPSTQPAGTVVAQNPVGGKAREGSTVRLNVAPGGPPCRARAPRRARARHVTSPRAGAGAAPRRASARASRRA
jgi:beta-lactam-binding protein with PASTA domain